LKVHRALGWRTAAIQCCNRVSNSDNAPPIATVPVLAATCRTAQHSRAAMFRQRLSEWI